MATPQPPTTVYIAGPMFSVGDKFEQSALAAALQAKPVSRAMSRKTTGSRWLPSCSF